MPDYKSISASTIFDASVQCRYLGVPDNCPVCHTGMIPRTVVGILKGSAAERDTYLRVIFQCTRQDCLAVFIGYYDFDHVGQQAYLLKRVAPGTPRKANIPETVSQLSPTFVEIFNQALAAEAENLDQVVGIALRKAFEFLIKDFAINQHPTKADAIKAAQLATCINNYCADPQLQSTASRAAWLGNDETHYTRVWVNSDINDLKRLIKLSVNWIENVLLTQQYEQEMDRNNPPTSAPSGAGGPIT